MDLLATQAIDRCQTPEGAEVALQDIDHFLESASELKLNDPKEFRNVFESIMSPHTKVSATLCYMFLSIKLSAWILKKKVYVTKSLDLTLRFGLLFVETLFCAIRKPVCTTNLYEIPYRVHN